MKRTILFCLAAFLISCEGDMSDSDFSFSEGTGSSLARITIKGDYLYLVNDNALYSINISVPEKPVVQDFITVGAGIETIYPFYNYLLIGSFNALYIYSLEEDPAKPQYLSDFRHWVGCDPVVAQGDYAYVTLRTGNGCNPTAIDQLDVVNISDPRQPFLVKSVPMNNPHGLAVSGNTLLVCEGTHGLSWMDISDPTQPVLDSLYTGFHAYDVIIRNNLVIVTGNDGYFQFDLSEGFLKKISEIEYNL